MGSSGKEDPPRSGPSDSEAPTVITSATPPTPGRIAPGQVLGGRYRIQAFLGRGAMGEVWSAFDLKLRVEVGLKAILPERLRDARRRELLRREVRAAREVISPNVCRIYDLVEAEGQELVSMEYIDGTTLLGRLERSGPLELRDAAEIAAQFLAGLEAIHQAGFVHRDIKPENLMITRAGRVVVMDFGIAKEKADVGRGTIAGTPAYMAPEQMRGEADARADVFAAAVVLAEMLGVEGRHDATACDVLWNGLRKDPPQLPESPWKPALLRAVAPDPRDRYPSARALWRALEEVTHRVSVEEDRSPYPGLASFTAEDAEFFFGRELEVEEMWKKLREPHLLGLIGPSGAGKSSFVRAGLVPAMPEGWRHLVCAPGNRPMMALAQALAPELSGDQEAVRELLRFDEPDVAVSVVERWRRRHEGALLVVDQFEELFTQSPPEEQARFAALLGRLALETDVHVLLSMRDDFLFRCHEFPALRPLLSELTLLGPPSGAALRRAVVQPALTCGYRFEDETLVDDMLAEVADERGALPLLAFAMARLWERRDREAGLLMRAAYREIGGVAGALAQHAEATLERIGAARQPVVREMFRNLVTAQGTRTSRGWDDLLSVFEERDAAEEVLRALIDARLLTSYEAPGETEGSEATRRVEIVHESLLSAWPRLVRWRTQDADGAQLRDQLRQAAQLWDEKNRPDDLLWTGTSYGEYQVWRERYPGGLSSAEEEFAAAMGRRATRRRRRRRLALVASFALLLAILAVVGWSEQRQRAERRRAEAARIMALAQVAPGPHQNPTKSVAYALASLELADDPGVRRFALEMLQLGPTALLLGPTFPPPEGSASAEFSPDGRRLAIAQDSAIRLWDASGSSPVTLTDHSPMEGAFFAPEADRLVSSDVMPSHGDGTVRVWSVPDGREVRTIDLEHKGILLHPIARGRLFTADLLSGDIHIQSWPFDGGDPTTLGRLSAEGDRGRGRYYGAGLAVDRSGTRLAYAQGNEVYLVPFEDLGSAPPRLLARHDGPVRSLKFHPELDRLGILTGPDPSKNYELHVVSPAGEEDAPPRVLPTGWTSEFCFDKTGTKLATVSEGGIKIWDLEGPPDVPVVTLRGAGGTWGLAFHPSGRWLARPPAIWPLGRPYPRVLSLEAGIASVAFAPDGRSLVVADRASALWRWPLTADSGERTRVVFKPGSLATALAFDPDGRHLLMAPGPRVLSLEGGGVRDLGVGFFGQAAAFGPEGRLAAFGGVANDAGIRVWDLESGEEHVLGAGEDVGTSELLLDVGAADIEMSSDGRRLVAATDDGVIVYDLETRTSHRLETGESHARRVAFDPTGTIVVAGHEDGVVSVGSVTGGARHLLLGHLGEVRRVEVSPDGRWIASAGWIDNAILWPMPDVTEPPFHTLPHNELLDRLRSLTNLRLLPDDEAPTGYRLHIEPFPGWDTIPTW